MELQKKEHPKQELTQQKSFNADPKHQFLCAISGEKIAYCPETKLREAMRYAMVKIGLRGANFPKGIEKSLLLQHVYENFGDLTPAEIRIAFDWAIDDRLELGPDGFNCFENFSCAYVSKILKAYLKRKQKVFLLPPPEEKPVLQIEQPISEEFKQSEFAEKLRKAGVKIPD
jgi:hypothetical protein